MALHGKMETTLELKSSAEKFYNVWRRESFHIPTHASKHIQGVDVHTGDWETTGSIRIWKYTVGGKPEVSKEEVHFDDENKVVTMNGLEGDAMKNYKVFKTVWQFTPKRLDSSVKLSLEYEKLHLDVPVPHIYVNFIVYMIKNIDEAISQA